MHSTKVMDLRRCKHTNTPEYEFSCPECYDHMVADVIADIENWPPPSAQPHNPDGCFDPPECR